MRWMVGFILVLSIACDRGSAPAEPSTERRLLVVASVYPLACIAREVGGDRVEVAWWIESGQALADYQPTAEQVEQMRRAVAILTNGAAEGPHTEQFAASFGDRRVIRLDRFAPLNRGDSQLWLDTSIVAKAARELGDRLAAVDHKHGDEYRARAEACIRRLESLRGFGAQVLAPLAGKRTCSIGKDYSAIGVQMGFSVLPIVNSSLLTLDGPAIARLPDELRQKQATLVIVEADNPPAAIAALKQTIGLPVAEVDSLGSSAPRGRNTYDKIMRYNYEQLAAALRRGAGE